MVFITIEDGRTMSLTEKDIILEAELEIVDVFRIKGSLKITKSMVKERCHFVVMMDVISNENFMTI